MFQLAGKFVLSNIAMRPSGIEEVAASLAKTTPINSGALLTLSVLETVTLCE